MNLIICVCIYDIFHLFIYYYFFALLPAELKLHELLKSC